ncbi:MAG: metal ABC transporter substrate-binding protein, partial [Cyanobacteria bacterium J06626_14]
MQRYFVQNHGVLAGTIALMLGLASCTSPTPANSDSTTESDTAATDVTDESQIDVVASYSVICDLATQIAEDAAQLNCLIPPDQDPHTYEAKPSDRQAVEEADLVFYAGLNFEPAIIDMATATDSE